MKRDLSDIEWDQVAGGLKVSPVTGFECVDLQGFGFISGDTQTHGLSKDLLQDHISDPREFVSTSGFGLISGGMIRGYGQFATSHALNTLERHRGYDVSGEINRVRLRPGRGPGASAGSPAASSMSSYRPATLSWKTPYLNR